MIEQHRAALPILNDGITDRLWAWSVGIGFNDSDETVSVAVREWVEEHGLHDSKDNRVRADAEREHEHDDNCENRRLSQASDRVSQFRPQWRHVFSKRREWTPSEAAPNPHPSRRPRNWIVKTA